MLFTKIRQFTAQNALPALAAAGVVIGCAAGALKWLIGSVAQLVSTHLDLGGGNWWLIFVGVAGIMLTGLFVRHVVRQPLEHATDRLRSMVKEENGTISPRILFGPMLASSLTLGFGGSAGSEGPIAYTGAAIGSNLGRLFGLNRQQMVVMMACGAGAGIAAIFKAPVGGIFFTVEVLRMELGLKPLLQLAGMCLIAGLTAYVISGDTYDLQLYTHPELELRHLPQLLLLGMLCGLYSAYYKWSGARTRKWLERIEHLPLRNLLSGLTLGVLLFLFPALFGEGYGALTQMANGYLLEAERGSVMVLLHSGTWLLPLSFAGILLLKGIAAYATNSGGGVAGEFAPTLFAGGVAGALFALLTGIPIPMAVVAGMAAVMAAVVRAPLMAIFITIEMTGQQQMLLPCALAAALAYPLPTLLHKAR